MLQFVLGAMSLSIEMTYNTRKHRNDSTIRELSLHWAEMISWTQFWVKWLKWLKWHKIYHSVLNGWSTGYLSTFGEPGLQEIPKDYTQASKMNKITVENTNTVHGDAVEAT